MLVTDKALRQELEPFGLTLSDTQVGQIRSYLELLLRWNVRINLTAVRSPDEALRRHFGESLYLSRLVSLAGRLLDVGSGAGFPGLALKIVFPSVEAILLEPIAKKRAFLKEVGRACGIDQVEIRPDRIEHYAGLEYNLGRFGTITARAVGQIKSLVGFARQCLGTDGRICLWLGEAQIGEAVAAAADLRWSEPSALPGSRQRVILIGTVSRETSSAGRPELSP